ncbi:MAG: hypothetical protein ACRD1K_19810 [Acidimicrobiales bacterium]
MTWSTEVRNDGSGRPWNKARSKARLATRLRSWAKTPSATRATSPTTHDQAAPTRERAATAAARVSPKRAR